MKSRYSLSSHFGVIAFGTALHVRTVDNNSDGSDELLCAAAYS